MTGPVSGAATTYYAYGRPRTVTDPDNYTITTDYDVFDRPTLVTYPDGTTEATTYDRLEVATRRDRRGRVTRMFHDALLRVTATRDPLGRETTYEYAANGIDLIATRQNNGGSSDLLETRASYVQHRPQTVTDASGQTTTFTYNSASQVLTATNAKNETTTYTYDADGRVQTVTGQSAARPRPTPTTRTGGCAR